MEHDQKAVVASYKNAIKNGASPLGVPRRAGIKTAFSVMCEELGLARTTARRMLLAGLGANPVPLSEDHNKFHAEWTPDDCIKELQRIANIDTNKVITRNYFRVHSDISESTWSRFFGSFAEFKRQAGVILSRHAHRLEKQIAKHASADRMRVLNEEKRDWEGNYSRPSSRRFQTVLVGADFHDKECDPFYRRMFLEAAKRAQPEQIVVNGDLFDLPELSKFAQDPRSFNLLERIKWVHAFLHDLRAAAPDAELTLVEGNHELRLLKHLAEATPALMVVLSDLHGFTVSKLLGLEQFEMNYIARSDLAAWSEKDITKELRKNYMMLYDKSLLFGHYPDMRNMGIPGASGHHHKHIVWSAYSPIYGPYEWHQTGCGHVREASYCAGEKWGNGFLLVHCDTYRKRSQFEYIDLSHEMCIMGGKFYQRLPEEIIHDQ